jgi:hypothetical protein
MNDNPIEGRADWPAQWLQLHANRGHTAEEIDLMRRTLRVAEVQIAMEPDDPDEDEPDGPKPFALELIDSSTFFSEVYPLDWLIEEVMVKDEPSVFGGPQKTLKTSILVAKAIALGTGTDFLGRFRVPNPIRVAMISGESGRRVIQSTARQVCRSQGIDNPSKANVLWGFKLPQLTVAQHIEVLRKTIEDNGIEAMIIDPFYLTIVAGKAGVDPKDMFQMGPLLTDMAQACLSAGATPDLAHHFVKRREDPHGLPEMSDLAGAGIGQFMRQWMLVAPRQAYDAEIGKFFLNFNYGGSAGHSGQFAVDIEVGKLRPDFDERKWVVSIASPSEERQSKWDREKEDRERKAEEKRAEKEAMKAKEERFQMVNLVEILKKHPEHQATANYLQTATRWNINKVKQTLYLLTEKAVVCEIETQGKKGNGATQKVTVYRLNDGMDVCDV